VVHEGFVAMGGSAGVVKTHEVAEGKTHISDGVASSGCLGAGDDMTPDDASAVVGIVTAPGHSEQKGCNDTWRVLAKLSVLSEPGNERLAMEKVAVVVKELGLSEQRLERLKTAVAEATMNAMEHGNRYRPEVPVVIEVLSSGADLSVRINDQGGIRDPAPDKEVPNLEAKLEGLQTPRGWGLFLIRNMVDEMHITSDEVHHTVGLVMHL
jgi:anti-sigma regulatory factor (Ser/Thr protein kinase)